MIKYFEFDSIDEYGQHIIPINNQNQDLIKTAANSYSPELLKVISNMNRLPERYYVVINALGAYEAWGSNRNGDAYPESGLKHASLRTDMGTPNDYGFKTFEYYGMLFKHHVNKDPKKSFGEVIFSHWNDRLKRIEIIVAIDRFKAKDLIDAIENDRPIACSMGCKVKFDQCCICDNKARTREKYCKHLKNYLGKIVTADLAALWTKETGKNILPGSMVFSWNWQPRFFDISQVHIGADRTSFVLGKAASAAIIAGIDIAEAYGVTDDMIDKLAVLGKSGILKKEIGGTISSDDADGRIAAISQANILKKKLDSLALRTMAGEDRIPNQVLDPISENAPLSTVLSTLLGLGIHPKPAEFQRIVLINIKRPDVANYLDDNHSCFDHTEEVEPVPLDVSNNKFNDVIAKALSPYIEKRSALSAFLEPRLKETMEKNAYANIYPEGERPGSVSPNDYWIEGGPETGSLIETSPISDKAKILGGLAALYAGLKLKAAGYGPKQIVEIFVRKPWLRTLVGGGIMVSLMNKIISDSDDAPYMRPISDYENVLQDTNFSGQIIKQSALSTGQVANALGLGMVAGAVLLPSAYVINAYNQKSLYRKGKQLFPGAGAKPAKMAATGAGVTALGTAGYHALKNILTKVR